MKDDDNSIDTLTECICVLQRRFNSMDVWYSKEDNEIVSVGYGDLIYYKLEGDQVIWKALY